MSLTTEQIRIQRGTRLLAREALPTAKRGVDFGVTHSDTEPTIISLWNVAMLGAQPTEVQAGVRGDDQAVVRLKKCLRTHASFRIDEATGSASEVARDALQLAFYANARHDRTLTAGEQSKADDLNAMFALIKSMRAASATVRSTIVSTDTLEEVKARYDAAIGV